MDILGIFGLGGLKKAKETGTQLYIRDDGCFEFRKLDIADSFLVERNARKDVIKAWLMRYKLQKDFYGYGNIPAAKVTLSYGRDIVYDPFDQLNGNEKPDKGEKLVKDFIKKIAEAICYKHEHQSKSNLFVNKIVWFLGITIVLLGLAFLKQVF